MSRFATAAKETMIERNGVKKPMVSEIATNRTPAKIKGAYGIENRFALLMTKAAAKEILNSKSATPGPP